jgi:hypothetical protein
MVFHAVAEGIYAMNTRKCRAREDIGEENPDGQSVDAVSSGTKAKGGKRNNKRKAPSTWKKPIVHLDIKPPNIFPLC